MDFAITCPAAAKSGHDGPCSDETARNSAEGDCRTAFAMTVKRECKQPCDPIDGRAVEASRVTRTTAPSATPPSILVCTRGQFMIE